MGSTIISDGFLRLAGVPLASCLRAATDIGIWLWKLAYSAKGEWKVEPFSVFLCVAKSAEYCVG